MTLVPSVEAGRYCPGKRLYSNRSPMDGRWTAIQIDPYQQGEIVDAVASWNDPGRIYAAFRRSVVYTRDGGCSWKVVLDERGLGSELPQLMSPRISSMTVTRNAAGMDRVHIAVVESAPPVPSSTIGILVMGPKGRWSRSSDEDLPLQVTADPFLMAAPGEPRAYLAVQEPRVRGSLGFYATNDGLQWKVLSSPGGDPDGPLSDAEITLATSDMTDGSSIWAWGEHEVWHSIDGAKTWRRIELPQEASFVRLVAPAGRLVFLATGDGAPPMGGALVSRNDGKSWSPQAMPDSTRLTAAWAHPTTGSTLIAVEAYGWRAETAKGGVWRASQGATSFRSLGAPFGPSALISGGGPRSPLIAVDLVRAMVAEYAGRW